MVRKLKLKSHNKVKYKSKKIIILTKIMVILSLVIASSFFVINIFNRKATPILLNYAELETKKLATVIINRAVSKQIANEISLDELVITHKNDNNEIESVDFNPYLVNKVLNSVTNTIQLNLKWLEEGKVDMIELPDGVSIDYDNNKLKKGIIYEIPMGVVTKNSFLSNLGPKIPVKLNLIGSVECEINSKLTHYGINNVYLEIMVHATVNEQVVLPFTSKVITVSTDIPVAMKIIEGKVPEYYSNGMNESSANFSIPIE